MHFEQLLDMPGIVYKYYKKHQLLTSKNNYGFTIIAVAGRTQIYLILETVSVFDLGLD